MQLEAHKHFAYVLVGLYGSNTIFLSMSMLWSKCEYPPTLRSLRFLCDLINKVSQAKELP